MTDAWSGENLAGSLLVATSALENTEFARSVIYVCKHSPKDGAMGVAVNCALPDPAVKDIWRQLDLPLVQARKNIIVGLGGPVDPTRGFVLHSRDWTDPDDLDPSHEGVASLTTGMDILHDMSMGTGPKKAMLLLGHAGWEPGQLEDEIVHGNAWLVAKANEEIVFSSDLYPKWKEALSSLGVDPLGLSSLIGDA